MSYDAIVIGSGLGGCSAGAALAGAGKKVLVLEKLDRIGGRCSSEEKDGFKLDMGCHFVIGCEHGAFEDALKRVGKEGEIEWHHFTNLLFKVEDTWMFFDGKKLQIEGSRTGAVITNTLSVIQNIFKLIPQPITGAAKSLMGNVVGRTMPGVGAKIYPVADRFDEVSVKTFMDKFLKAPKLRDVVELGQFAMFGTPSWMTATSELIRTMLGVLEYCKPGVGPMQVIGYPIGGLIEIPRTLCEGIEDRGGEVRTNANVKKVVIEAGKAVGVELDDGEVIKAPLIVSNAGIKETVAGLVGEDKYESGYAGTVRKLLPGVSPCTIRCALDTKITDLDGVLGIAVGGLEDYYRKMWSDHIVMDVPPPIMFSSPSNMDPSAAPPGKQLVVAICALVYEAKEEHSKMEQLMLQALEHVIPGINEHMMWHDFLSPETYMVYGEQCAPAIGIAQCMGQVGKKRPSSVSPINGLFYVGGEAGRDISGVACDMCTKSGLACADYILRNE